MDIKIKQKSLEDQLYYFGLAALVIGGLLVWVYFTWLMPNAGIKGCIWETNFGIYCPGCGGTRAVKALLQGHFLLSVWYHPLVPYTVVVFGSFMVSQIFARLTRYHYCKGIRFHNWYLYGAVGILLGNMVLKNLLRQVWGIIL